ncbi:protein phosphatase 1 regulatory subunit 16A-like [Ptychodera flava]|uniref:protein phosphatase 1 regulatory subunit 16A-like n=1 Tax=Ptychodera flava TaxID=63121 RepID=UPI003969EBDB
MKQTMTEHSDLIAEITVVEKMTAQERLKHAKKRRTQQLKRYNQHEKERLKKERKGLLHHHHKSAKRKRVNFANNVTLLEAAARGDVSEVRKLLQNGMSPDLTNDDGLTALHQCCIDDNEEMMKVLIDFGANTNARDSELWTPLHAAATCGHVHLAEYLLTKGADILAINSDGNMPYDISEDDVTLDYIESVMASRGITQEQIDDLRRSTAQRMLRDLYDAVNDHKDLEGRDCHGATALHVAAANGYLEVAEFLLDHHVNVDVRDNDGWQPIHAAACWAQPEMIGLLAVHGADLEARTYNDETPADICEDPDTRQKLIEVKKEIINNKKNRVTLVRRNSSRNRRSASVRRTSMRDKKEIARRDAKAEAELMNIPREDQPSPEHAPTASIGEISVEISSHDTVDPPPQIILQSGNEVSETVELEPTQDSYKDRHHKNVTIALGSNLEPEQGPQSKPSNNKKKSILKKSTGKENKKSKKEKKEERRDREEKIETKPKGMTKADKYYQDKYKQDSASHSTLMDLKRQRASKQKFIKDHTFDTSLDDAYQPVPKNMHRDSVDMHHYTLEHQNKSQSLRKLSPVVIRKGTHEQKNDNSARNTQPPESDVNGTSRESSSISPVDSPVPNDSYLYLPERDKPYHFKGEVEEVDNDEDTATCCVVM